MSSKKGNEASSSRGGESIVADCGRNTSTCGYCKSPASSSISHGLWTERLTVHDYQALLDRGWRRSGCYLYKPEMAKTCCPSYTIRLRACDFVPSKEQQRVRRRLERFLDGELDLKQREQTEDSDVSLTGEVSQPVIKSLCSGKREQKDEVEPVMKDLSEQIDDAVQRCIQSGELPSNIQIPKSSVKKVLSAKRKKLAEGSEELLYTSNIAFPIVAAIKHTQVSQKGEGSNNAEENRLSPEIVSEKLLSEMNKVGEFPGLAIKVCKGHINFFSATQVTCSETDQGESFLSATTTKSSSNIFQVTKRKLEIHLKRSSFDPEEYKLYKRYQLIVHNDEPESISKKSYKRFLVDTPLIEVLPSSDENVPPCGFGSYHQQYRVDGRLIAVGVIDILPKCLSSKYLFWDPDFASLSLGNYSALQEIDWVNQNQPHCSTLEYYYLGYYIHSCSKMKYKAAYRPSELLCPLRYQWVPFEVAKPLLDKKPYTVLSDFSKASLSPSPQAPETLVESTSGREDMEMNNSDEDSDSDSSVKGIDITNVLISLNGSRLRYKDLSRIINMAVRKQLEPMFFSYRKVVGAELSERMVYELQ